MNVVEIETDYNLPSSPTQGPRELEGDVVLRCHVVGHPIPGNLNMALILTRPVEFSLDRLTHWV